MIEFIDYLRSVEFNGREVAMMYFIYNAFASAMPKPSDSEWYRFFYKLIQFPAANFENFRTKGAKYK